MKNIEDLENQISDISFDTGDFLSDSEEFRINLLFELKKFKEFNENLINVSSDEVTQNAEQNLFLIGNILTLIDEQKIKEEESPLNKLVQEFEKQQIQKNEESNKTISIEDLINNNIVLKRSRRLETLRKYNFHLVQTNKISFEKYKKGVDSLKIQVEKNWDKFIPIKKEEEVNLHSKNRNKNR